MRPLISVVVPIYNVEKYLNKCIDSIINQSYSNLEIILVDDGSPDRCGQICNEYREKDPRVVVIHKKNGGLSSARNAGIETYKGKYIVFIDSDDFISSTYIEDLYNAVHKYNVDIATFSWYVDFYDENENQVKLDTSKTVHDAVYQTSEVLKKMFYQKIPSGVPHRLFARKIFEEIRFPVGDLFEEMATVYKMYIAGSKKSAIVYGKEYAYRLRPTSIVRMNFSEKKLICVPISQRMYKDILDYNKNLNKSVSSRLFAFNFQIFLQVPGDDLNNQKLVWNEIKKYRGSVLIDFNKSMRLKNRAAALISLLGMRMSHIIGRKVLYKK